MPWERIFHWLAAHHSKYQCPIVIIVTIRPEVISELAEVFW